MDEKTRAVGGQRRSTIYIFYLKSKFIRNENLLYQIKIFWLLLAKSSSQHY